LKIENPSRWIPKDKLLSNAKSLGIITVLLLSTALFPPHLLQSGWNRLIHGVGYELGRYIAVSPEGGKVLEGEPVTITGQVLKGGGEDPQLFVRTPEGWQEVEGAASPSGTLFHLQPIREETAFKVSWKKMESRAYVLTPIQPPRLVDFTATLKFPAC